MEELEETKKKKKLSTGLIVGLIAILINVITVSVYMYQTNIMQKQQHASVWPHLEWTTSYNDAEGFMFVVKNNGIGPALVKNTSMRLAGEDITHLDTLCARIVGTSRFPHLKGFVNNRVIPPGEKIVLLKSENQKWSELLYYGLQKSDFTFEVCYESIYEEQWTCKGREVVKGSCH